MGRVSMMSVQNDTARNFYQCKMSNYTNPESIRRSKRRYTCLPTICHGWQIVCEKHLNALVFISLSPRAPQNIGGNSLNSSVLKIAQMRDQSENPGCCRQCGYTLRNEFQRAKFSLAHNEPSDFCRSQWQRGKRSLIWLIYRWLVAAFFSAGVIYSMITVWGNGTWWIYLTDWGFLLCMYTFIYGAVIATYFYFKPNYFAPDSLALKIYWASHWSTLVLATMITLVFWAVLFPMMNGMGVDLYNIWAHACNSFFMILDHMLVAFPSRLMHFVYPFAVGLTYGFFSLFYYVGDGTDAFGHRYIYPILNWSEPGLAIGTVVACIVLVSLFCFMHFWLYRLRVLLHKKYAKPAEPALTGA